MAARHRFMNNQVATDSWSITKTFSSFSKEIDTDDQTGSRFDQELEIMSVASRDRTNEFSAVLKSIRTRQSNGFRSKSHVKSSLLQRSDFSKYAKSIGQDLAKTYEKLEKLTLLCKKRTLFDDRPIEIQELTYIIKQDITSLKRQIQQLEDTKSGGHVTTKRDVQRHTSSVVRTLRSKLATMSESFKSVLETRRENMKEQKLRKDQYSSSNPSAMMPASATEGTRGSVLLRDDQRPNRSSGSVAISMGGDPVTRLGPSSSPYQTTQLVEQQDNYITERAETMETIETTIVELGNIFQQLATMVKEQEEVVMRIDSNVEESELNVEAAHTEILKYFQGITSNRWLMIKVFFILIVFFLIFVVFFA